MYDAQTEMPPLVDTGTHILIADFKTGSSAPANGDDVPEAYIRQLALYREVVAKIYPGKEVVCLIIACADMRDMALMELITSIRSRVSNRIVPPVSM